MLSALLVIACGSASGEGRTPGASARAADGASAGGASAGGASGASGGGASAGGASAGGASAGGASVGGAASGARDERWNGASLPGRTGHPRGEQHVFVSADGSRVLYLPTSSLGGEARVLDVATDEVTALPLGVVGKAAVSHDLRVAVVDRGKRVEIWDLTGARRLAEHRLGSVIDLAVAGETVAVLTPAAVHLGTGGDLRRVALNGPSGAWPGGLALAADGRTFAVDWGTEGYVGVHRDQGQRRVRLERAEEQMALAFDASGRRLAVGLGRKLVVYDARSLKPLREIGAVSDEHELQPWAGVWFDDEGDRLAIRKHGAVAIVAASGAIRALPCPVGDVRSLRFLDAEILATTDADAVRWRGDGSLDPRYLRSIPRHPEAIVALDPPRVRIESWAWTLTWNVATGRADELVLHQPPRRTASTEVKVPAGFRLVAASDLPVDALEPVGLLSSTRALGHRGGVLYLLERRP